MASSKVRELMVLCVQGDVGAMATARATYGAMTSDNQALMRLVFAKALHEPLSDLSTAERMKMGYPVAPQSRPGSHAPAGGRILTPEAARARLKELEGQ